MTYPVLLTQRAETQLNEAAQWYAQQAQDVADAWFHGFVQAIVSLETNPKLHSLAREDEAFPFELRQLLYGLGKRKTHRALFVVHADRVVVHAVRHLAQDDLTLDDLT